MTNAVRAKILRTLQQNSYLCILIMLEYLRGKTKRLNLGSFPGLHAFKKLNEGLRSITISLSSPIRRLCITRKIYNAGKNSELGVAMECKTCSVLDNRSIVSRISIKQQNNPLHNSTEDLLRPLDSNAEIITNQEHLHNKVLCKPLTCDNNKTIYNFRCPQSIYISVQDWMQNTLNLWLDNISKMKYYHIISIDLVPKVTLLRLPEL